MATVKVSKRTYRELNEIAGKLRARMRRPVSVDEAIEFAMRRDKLKPADFAGSLSLTDKEEAEISEKTARFWSRWRLQRE
jgi:cobalamin biosynthesis protein CbiG